MVGTLRRVNLGQLAFPERLIDVGVKVLAGRELAHRDRVSGGGGAARHEFVHGLPHAGGDVLGRAAGRADVGVRGGDGLTTCKVWTSVR